jgi:hypothetical protein
VWLLSFGYLRENLKEGSFAEEEEILRLVELAILFLRL